MELLYQQVQLDMSDGFKLQQCRGAKQQQITVIIIISDGLYASVNNTTNCKLLFNLCKIMILTLCKTALSKKNNNIISSFYNCTLFSIQHSCCFYGITALSIIIQKTRDLTFSHTTAPIVVLQQYFYNQGFKIVQSLYKNYTIKRKS